jgi:hypothetical protein
MDTTESELPVPSSTMPWLTVARGTESDSAHVGRHHFMCSESLELELVAVAVAVVAVARCALRYAARGTAARSCCYFFNNRSCCYFFNNRSYPHLLGAGSPKGGGGGGAEGGKERPPP